MQSCTPSCCNLHQDAHGSMVASISSHTHILPAHPCRPPVAPPWAVHKVYGSQGSIPASQSGTATWQTGHVVHCRPRAGELTARGLLAAAGLGQVVFAAVPMSKHIQPSAAAVVTVNEASASTAAAEAAAAAAMTAFVITATSNSKNAYLAELVSLAAIYTTVAIHSNALEAPSDTSSNLHYLQLWGSCCMSTLRLVLIVPAAVKSLHYLNDNQLKRKEWDLSMLIVSRKSALKRHLIMTECRNETACVVDAELSLLT